MKFNTFSKKLLKTQTEIYDYRSELSAMLERLETIYDCDHSDIIAINNLFTKMNESSKELGRLLAWIDIPGKNKD